MIGAVLISVMIVSAAPDLSPEVPAAYEINAYLNDSSHTISATEAVTFLRHLLGLLPGGPSRS
jgi:hypothetical protein